jgi:hypothetical protein
LGRCRGRRHSISSTLAIETSDKAINLTNTCVNENDGGVDDLEGQAGVVFDRQNVLFLVNAKHNLVSEENEAGELFIAHAVRTLSGAGVSALANFKGSLGWKNSNEEWLPLRDDVFWEYGRDVIWGDRADSPPNGVLNSVSAF